MSKNTSKPNGLPPNFDPMLNLTYNINRLYDFVSKKNKYTGTQIQDALKGLLQLKNERRRLGLISNKKYSKDAITGLNMLSEYLTHKDAGFTYVVGANGVEGMYDCFHRIFKESNPNSTDRIKSMVALINNTIELAPTGFFEPFTKYEYYNYIYYFNQQGEVSAREVPAMLDILFDCKLRPDVDLLLSI